MFHCCHHAMAVDGPCLDGLAEDWDAAPRVREHMRVRQFLFAPELRRDDVRCNVPCAERNYDALIPLAKRLSMPDGSLGQLRVPDLIHQNFVRLSLCNIFCKMYCGLRGFINQVIYTFFRFHQVSHLSPRAISNGKDQAAVSFDDDPSSSSEGDQETSQTGQSFCGSHQEEVGQGAALQEHPFSQAHGFGCP